MLLLPLPPQTEVRLALVEEVLREEEALAAGVFRKRRELWREAEEGWEMYSGARVRASIVDWVDLVFVGWRSDDVVLYAVDETD